MNEPKHHHYVPQFYLRQFSPNNDKISVFLKERSVSLNSQSTSRFGGINHLYKVDTLGSSDKLIYESNFSKLEGRAKPVIDGLENKNELSWEDASDLAFFVATLAERGPYNINFTRALLKAGIESAKHGIQRNDAPVPVELYELLGDIEKPEEIQSHLMLMMLQQAMYLTQIVIDKGWHFFHSADHHFITSDRPVSFYSYSENLSNREHADTDVIVPLTKNICLLATAHLDDLPLHIDANLEIVNTLNEISFSNAKKFVFGDSSATLENAATLNSQEKASVCQSMLLFGVSKEFPPHIFENR